MAIDREKSLWKAHDEDLMLSMLGQGSVGLFLRRRVKKGASPLVATMVERAGVRGEG